MPADWAAGTPLPSRRYPKPKVMLVDGGGLASPPRVLPPIRGSKVDAEAKAKSMLPSGMAQEFQKVELK